MTVGSYKDLKCPNCGYVFDTVWDDEPRPVCCGAEVTQRHYIALPAFKLFRSYRVAGGKTIESKAEEQRMLAGMQGSHRTNENEQLRVEPINAHQRKVEIVHTGNRHIGYKI